MIGGSERGLKEAGREFLGRVRETENGFVVQKELMTERGLTERVIRRVSRYYCQMPLSPMKGGRGKRVKRSEIFPEKLAIAENFTNGKRRRWGRFTVKDNLQPSEFPLKHDGQIREWYLDRSFDS